MLLTWSASSGLNPTLSLDFLTPVLDGRITASGGANGTRVNSSGLIVAATTPRFDYNPVTLACKGLLVEEARTNLVPKSSGAGISAGIGSTVSGITSSVVGTGTESGLDYVDIRIAGTPALASIALDPYLFGTFPQFALSAGASNSLSAYGRVVSSTGGPITPKLYLVWETGASAFLGLASLSLDTGAASIGKGRSSVSGTSPASTAQGRVALAAEGMTAGVAVDVTVRIGGCQAEVGAFPTSYIPTTSAAVTRTADSLTMTGTNFSSWFNASEGTFVMEHMTAGVEGTRAVCEANNNTVNNRIGTYYFASLNVNSFIRDGGSSAAFGGTSFTANTPTLSALAYKAGDYALCTRGQAVSGNAFATVPSVDQLGIGGSAAVTSEYMNGWLRSLRFFPRRLTNSQLQVLT